MAITREDFASGSSLAGQATLSVSLDNAYATDAEVGDLLVAFGFSDGLETTPGGSGVAYVEPLAADWTVLERVDLTHTRSGTTYYRSMTSAWKVLDAGDLGSVGAHNFHNKSQNSGNRAYIFVFRGADPSNPIVDFDDDFGDTTFTDPAWYTATTILPALTTRAGSVLAAAWCAFGGAAGAPSPQTGTWDEPAGTTSLHELVAYVLSTMAVTKEGLTAGSTGPHTGELDTANFLLYRRGAIGVTVREGVFPRWYTGSVVFLPRNAPTHGITFDVEYWADDLALADGAAVAQWNDRGVGGYHLLQATGANQPTYRASVAGLNGKPAVEGDGVSDYLQVLFPNIGQQWTMVVIGRAPVVTGNRSFVGPGTIARTAYMGMHSSGIFWNFDANTTWTSALTTADTSGHLFIGGYQTYRIDGTDKYPGSGNQTSGIDGLTVFAGPSLTGGRAPVNFQIAYLAVKSASLTAGEIAALRSWAQSYYGTP